MSEHAVTIGWKRESPDFAYETYNRDHDWTFDAGWHCAEWYVDVTAKSYRFFSDSTEVTSLAFTGNANAKMSSYTAIVVGSIFYQTPPSPFVQWLDDLAARLVAAEALSKSSPAPTWRALMMEPSSRAPRIPRTSSEIAKALEPPPSRT